MAAPGFCAPAPCTWSDVAETAADALEVDRTVPVIDLAGLQSGDPGERERIARQVGKAAEEWGFFQVVNHGIPDELFAKVQEQAREFFSLPQDEKQRAEVVGPNPRRIGYDALFAKGAAVKPGTDLLLREALGDLCRGTTPDPALAAVVAKVWPAGNSTFRETLEHHTVCTQALGRQLMELLAESVGLHRTFFSKHFEKGEDYICHWRLHHFPANAPSSQRGANAHCDPSVLTVVKQHNAGLEIKKQGQGWVAVQLLPESYIINIGDILEAWSNGRFFSVEHRTVLKTEGSRFSTVSFMDAGMSKVIEAPPELIDDDHPSQFRSFKAREYRDYFEKAWRSGNIEKGRALDCVRRQGV